MVLVLPAELEADPQFARDPGERPRNQVARESAFTAIDTRVASPAPLIPSSARASRSSRAS